MNIDKKGGFITRILFFFLLIVGLFLGGIYGLLRFRTDMVASFLEAQLSSFLNGRQVNISSLDFRDGISIKKFAIWEKNKKSPFFSCDSARIKIAILPLFSGKILVESGDLKGLNLDLIIRDDGTLNIQDLLSGDDRAKTAKLFSGAWDNGEYRTGDDRAKTARSIDGILFDQHILSKIHLKFAGSAPSKGEKNKKGHLPPVEIDKFQIDRLAINLKQKDEKAEFNLWLNDILITMESGKLPEIKGEIQSENQLKSDFRFIPQEEKLIIDKLELDIFSLYQNVTAFHALNKKMPPMAKDLIAQGHISGNIKLPIYNPLETEASLFLKEGKIGREELFVEGLSLSLKTSSKLWEIPRGDLLFAGQALSFSAGGQLDNQDGSPLEKLQVNGHGLDAVAISKFIAPKAQIPGGIPPAELFAQASPDGENIVLNAKISLPGLNIESSGPIYPEPQVKLKADADLKLMGNLLIAMAGLPLSELSGLIQADMLLPALSGSATLQKGLITFKDKDFPSIKDIFLELKGDEEKWEGKGGFVALDIGPQISAQGRGLDGLINVKIEKGRLENIIRAVPSGILPQGLEMNGILDASGDIKVEKGGLDSLNWQVACNSLTVLYPDFPAISGIQIQVKGGLDNLIGSLDSAYLGPVAFSAKSLSPLDFSLQLNPRNINSKQLFSLLPKDIKSITDEYKISGALNLAGDGAMKDQGFSGQLRLNNLDLSIKPPILKKGIDIIANDEIKVELSGFNVPKLVLKVGKSQVNTSFAMNFDTMELGKSTIKSDSIFLGDLIRILPSMPFILEGQCDLYLNAKGKFPDINISGNLNAKEGIMAVPLDENWDIDKEKRDIYSDAQSIKDSFFRVAFKDFESILTMTGTVLNIERVKFKSFDGNLTVTGKVNLDPLTYNFDIDGKNLQINSFLEKNMSLDKDAMVGKLTVKGNIYGEGSSAQDMKGRIDYNAQGCVINSLPAFTKFLSLLKLKNMDNLPLSDVKGFFRIENGQIILDDVKADSDMGTAQGGGRIWFDKRVEAHFDAGLKPPALAGTQFANIKAGDLEKNKLSVKLGGTLEDPKLSTNGLEILLKLAISPLTEKKDEKVQQLQENVSGQIQQKKEELENKIKGGLESLFQKQLDKIFP